MLKKIGALVLVLAMVLTMATAWADDGDSGNTTGNSTTSAAPTLATSGDTGVAGTWTEKDTEKVDSDRKINIVKEILSYNATSTSVYAPEFSYVYTVKPATIATDTTVTDEVTDHTSSSAVKAPVKAGLTTKLKVNKGTDGNSTSAVGYLDLDNTKSLITSSDGGSTTFNIELDFSEVSFTQPGVYRYEITETITKKDHTTAVTYDNIAVEDGGSNVRYLDVYVDGSLAIYGYVCMSNNASVTSTTTKTNGFVKASDGADKYYTYDLELSKDVVNDAYGEKHAFPFTVIFQNQPSYENTSFKITETATGGSTGIYNGTSNPLTGLPTWKGVAKVKKGANITYTGIPAGVDVDVYETNDMTGVTYAVSSVVNTEAAVKDASVSWGEAPTTATAQANPKANAYESTKVTVDTDKYTVAAGEAAAKAGTTTQQKVVITNTLLLISPTGVVLRVAPYVLMLAAGVALLVLAMKRRGAKEEV